MAKHRRPDKSRRSRPDPHDSAHPPTASRSSIPSASGAAPELPALTVPNCAISPHPTPPFSIEISEIPEFHSTVVPEKWRKHTLIHGRFFYTLPIRLLQAVEEIVGVANFDANVWGLETDLAAITGNHEFYAGFSDGHPIDFTYLSEFRYNQTALEYIRTTLQPADPERVIREARERMDRVGRGVRAYAGWLLTNPLFLEEHAALITNISGFVREGRWPQRIPAGTPGSFAALGWQTAERKDDSAAVRALDGFCSRWRLSDLSGPLLPMPIGIQAPAMLPQLAAQHAIGSGYGTIAIPDTMPTPSETDLRAMVEGAIRPALPEHLRGWGNLIDPSNEGKKALDRFARVFPLQHYYRLLRSRHSQAFHRRMGQFELAFARFFHLSEDTIRRDLELVKERLEDKWWDRFPMPVIGAV